MVLPYKHSYAVATLRKRQITISAGDKELFTNVPPFINIEQEPDAKTQIKVGEKFVAKGEIYRITSYDELRSLGYVISSRSPKMKTNPYQQVEYLLVKGGTVTNDYGKIPKGHFIMYDQYNSALRLVGIYACPMVGWVYIRHKVAQKQEKRSLDPLEHYRNMYSRHKPFASEEDIKYEEIKEIPIMVTSEGGGKLVCLPRENERQIIGVFGMAGSGKTTLMHSILDGTISLQGHNGIILNDFQSETGSWCMPWYNQAEGLYSKRVMFNPESIPLPIVYLHPNTNTLLDENMIHPQEVGMKMSLPSKTILKDINRWFKSRKNWLLSEASRQRYDNLINEHPELLTCDTYEGMLRYITPEAVGNKDVYGKITSILRGLMNEQMLDSNAQAKSEWTVTYPDGRSITTYPWDACILAGLVPSIVTSDLRHKPYYPDYLSFVLEDIYEKQGTQYYKRNEIMTTVLIDEIHNLKDYYDIIDMVFKEGRMRNMPILYGTQNAEEISQNMNVNTNTVFMFRSKKQQMDKLSGDYHLLENQRESMKRLKKFECLAATTKCFILYDSDGNREVIENCVLRGKILPSLSMHSAPMERTR